MAHSKRSNLTTASSSVIRTGAEGCDGQRFDERKMNFLPAAQFPVRPRQPDRFPVAQLIELAGLRAKHAVPNDAPPHRPGTAERRISKPIDKESPSHIPICYINRYAVAYAVAPPAIPFCIALHFRGISARP